MYALHAWIYICACVGTCIYICHVRRVYASCYIYAHTYIYAYIYIVMPTRDFLRNLPLLSRLINTGLSSSPAAISVLSLYLCGYMHK